MVSPSTAHLYTEIAASVLRYNFLTWHVLFLFPYWEISAHLFPCLCCLCHYSRCLPESHFCAPTASPVPSMACCVCHSCQMMWCSEANQIAFSSHMVFWFAFSHVRLLLCCLFMSAQSTLSSELKVLQIKWFHFPDNLALRSTAFRHYNAIYFFKML